MFNIHHISPFISIGVLDLKAYAIELKSEMKREIEKKGTVYILNKMLKDYQNELDYSPSNKPYLKGREEHISISHSHDKLAIIVNTQENTGIDIELIRDKVQKIQHKFLNEQELKMANNNSETLISFWAIKETLYKLHGLKEVDFIKHLYIESYSEPEIIGRIAITGSVKKYRLAKKKIEDYMMVYAVNEI